MSKYRWRTIARRNLPWSISKYIRKGKGDCGDHEWYIVTPHIKACYHCPAEMIDSYGGQTVILPTKYNSFGR